MNIKEVQDQHRHCSCVKIQSVVYSLAHPCCFLQGQGGAYSLCEVCNLQLTSPGQAQLHYNGKSHLRRVRQLQAGETGQQATGTARPLLSCSSSGICKSIFKQLSYVTIK